MKTLGIIGGIGPESTMEYYRRLIALYRQKITDGSYPQIVLNSINLTEMLAMLSANQLPELTQFLLGHLETLARAGADFAVIAANAQEQDYIHEKYFGELVHGTVLAETRQRLIGIVESMKSRDGINGLIVGGTELSLIFREPEVCGILVLDTTPLHVEAAISRM